MNSAMVRSNNSSELKSTPKSCDNSATSTALIVRFLRVVVGVAAMLALVESFGKEIVIFRAVFLTVEVAGRAVEALSGVSGMC